MGSQRMKRKKTSFALNDNWMDTWGAYHFHKPNFVHKNITTKIDVEGV